MSLKDFVVCAGKGTAAAASGVLTYTNSAIQAGDVCVATLNFAVGTATTILNINSVVSAGSVAIQGTLADGSVFVGATPISFIVVRPSAGTGAFA